MSEIKKIGRHKYNYLKNLKNPTKVEKQQIELYEKERGIGVIYKINKPKPKPVTDGIELNLQNIWIGFANTFHKNEGVKFNRLNRDSVKNLEPIAKYFAGDESFASSDRIVKHCLGTDLQPSLKKGLLIIGHPGNGKTSIMNAMQVLFDEVYKQSMHENWINGNDWRSKRFLGVSSIQVSQEYEALKEPLEKEDFFKKYTGFRYFFDDVGHEHVANNYGKKDVFKDIIFERYRKKSLTYVTMNYIGKNASVSSTLQGIGQRYGSHIFDRFFEMFNIIEFKGSSYRK